MQHSNLTQLTPKKRSLIFVNLVVSGLASSTLATAMTTALPNLVADFGVSTDIGQWVTSGYSLATGVVMPLTAFLITRFPTKRLYMAGIGSFLIGLLLSIFAGNFGVMMAGRVIQACGNGILLSAAQVVILTVYPPEKRGGMMGTYGLATTAAPIIAPTIAGLMIDAFGWRSIFYLVLGIMAVSFVLSAVVFENVLELQEKHFDFPSFVGSVFAFGGITLGVGNLSAFGLASWQAGAPLVVGGGGLRPVPGPPVPADHPLPGREDPPQPGLRRERGGQHAPLPGHDGLLGDDAPVCAERHGLLCSGLRPGDPAGLSGHGPGEPPGRAAL